MCHKELLVSQRTVQPGDKIRSHGVGGNNGGKASFSSGRAGRINPLKFCCLLRKGTQGFFFLFFSSLRKPENSFKNTKPSAFSLNYRVGVGEGTAWLLFCAAGCIFWWLLFHLNVLGLDFVLFFLVCLLFWTRSAATLSFSLGKFWGFSSSFVKTSLSECCRDSNNTA